MGCRWTTPRTPCGSFLCPQSVESVHPRIHRGLTWPDGPTTAPPVDTIGTTSRSPGCGRQKVPESVESGRNPARIRTDGAEGMTSERRRAATESGRGVPRRVPERRSGGCRAALPGAWGEAGTRVGRSRRGSRNISKALGRPRGSGADARGVAAWVDMGSRATGTPAGTARAAASGCRGCRGGKRKAPAGACPGGALAGVRPSPSAVLDAVGELGDLVVDRAALGHQRADLAVGVHDRRVVAAAELGTDLRQ